MAQVREVVARRNEIPHLPGVPAAELRGKLGEPAASVAKFNRALEQATSLSPEAEQQLAEGYRRHLAMDIPPLPACYGVGSRIRLALCVSRPAMAHRLSSIWRPQMKRRPLNEESGGCADGARSARATGIEAEPPRSEVRNQQGAAEHGDIFHKQNHLNLGHHRILHRPELVQH